MIHFYIGMHPDSFTFGSLLRATVGSDGLTRVKIIHGYIFQFGLGSHEFLTASLIDAYVECGSMDNANRVYNTRQIKDLVSCTALIKGYACEGTDITRALQLFNDIHKNTTIDGMLLCSMINICAKTASLSLGRQLHANSLKFQNQHDVAVGNALIDMYSKSGVIQNAKRVFDEMEVKNVISWTSLIAGYGKNGYGREALTLYVKMENEGLKPNDVTFLSAIFACSHNGLTREGVECFNDMVQKHEISPRLEHYCCLVDHLARGGHLEEAYELVCKIEADCDASVLGALLGACSTYGNVNMGRIVGRRLRFSLGAENPANYVALSGIYAGAGLWRNAMETRMLMKKNATFKYPGYSLCQLTS